ncbi:MAG: hypothetical protein WCX65_17715 [bacterium]
MKFKIDHRFEGSPYEDVLHFLTEENVFDPKNMPNVKGNKALVEKITEDKKYWKNQWSAHGQIPSVVQHLIKPEMLSWIEETTYDRKNKTYFTKITPFYFKNVFFCESRGYFVKANDREIIRVTEGELRIKFPVFGQFVEEQIIMHMKQNFDIEYRSTYKIVKERFGGGNKS